MESSKMNNTQALIEYLLNKFVPYALLGFCLFLSIGPYNVNMYIIVGIVIFIDKYSFNLGRSMAEYENNPDFKKQVDDSLDD